MSLIICSQVSDADGENSGRRVISQRESLVLAGDPDLIMMFIYNILHSPLQKYFEYDSYPASYLHLMSSLSPLCPVTASGATTTENRNIIIYSCYVRARYIRPG